MENDRKPIEGQSVVIDYVGMVSKIGVHQLIEATSQAQSQKAMDVTLRISSPGGCMTMGFTAYNHLRSLAIPLTTINLSNVDSAGNLLYFAADTRLAFPHATWLFHGLTWTFEAGDCTMPVIRERLESLEFDSIRYAKLIKERTQERLDVGGKLNCDSIRVSVQEASTVGITTAPASVIALPTNCRHIVIRA